MRPSPPFPICVLIALSIAHAFGQDLHLPVYPHVWHAADVDKSGTPKKTLVAGQHPQYGPFEAKTGDLCTYYDTNGRLLKTCMAAPGIIGRMATHELYVPSSGRPGNRGQGRRIRAMTRMSSPTRLTARIDSGVFCDSSVISGRLNMPLPESPMRLGAR